jgi:NAD+ kinase
MKIKSVGLIVASHRRPAMALVKEAVSWLKARKVKVLLTEFAARELNLEALGAEAGRLAAECDLFISLGGDGAFLTAARLAAPVGKPALGVHLGGFGFLAEVPEAKFFPALQEVLKGGFYLQERMMLSAEVTSGEDRAAKWEGIALNEVVIANSGISRVISLRTDVGGRYLSGFSADGLIISTPTGSTAYSLAAGGPVVDPQIRAIILTPISAHTLSARPLVVPADKEVEAHIGPTRRDQAVRITADGQTGTLLEAGDYVRVRQAPFPARLVCFDKEKDLGAGEFYEKLRSKLGWGRRR